MALTTTKKTTFTGESSIEGTPVVFLSASLTTETAGNTSITQSISNTELYKANKVQCRQDISDFQELVWELEDAMVQELLKSAEE